MKKIRLFTPGPVMVPEDVMLTMARPMEHHRTSFYREMLADVTEHLEYLFQTEKANPLVITGSGTAAGEASIVSAVHPGKNKALNLNAGKFGQRWGKICKAFGIDCVDHEIEWGTGADGDLVSRLMDQDDRIDTILCVHSETSTATASDIESVARVASERGALLIVDCITSCGCLPFKFDEWDIGIAFTGSQKALMLPPGLGLACVSPKAWRRIDESDCTAFYNDLKAYRKSVRNWDNPYTPANTLVLGLQKVLHGIKERGLESIWQETRMLADATRAACKAMGMELFSKNPVDSVTAMVVPDGVDEGQLRKTMRSKYGMQIAGGQDHIKGKVIRIGHMGYVDSADTLAVIGALELALIEQGHKMEIGSGLKAAQEVFAKVL